MSDTIIDLAHIHFSYGQTIILKDVSLSVSEGEIVSLIGPNGAGKSTLILLSMGLISPLQGSIEIDDKPIDTWSSRDFGQFCAFVPQNPNLPLSFTVWESVLLGRTPYLGFLGIAKKEDKEKVSQALSWVEIEDLKHRKISELSGGERQRVVLARALAQDPRCLFLDEPTNSLDVHHQVKLLSFIRKCAKERQVTVFIVLHDLNLASSFSDRLILLHKGEIVLQGTPGEVMGKEEILSVYKESITIFPRPDEKTRPAILPVLEYDK
ncbi:MAG: ABC transporter ATP-binding protein [Spirochaetales bacterium]|nr:ABC transporter ATP-binding protein [Spirochaetales bacterium]